MSAITFTKHQSRYSVAELLLILVAAALVGFTTWYITHATTITNSTYSIHESSQKPGTPKKDVTNKATTPQ
ncbi:MAG TPA: hypothetical protein VFI84_01695 [Candidatus Saccharimonadales bacterium]|nr:hypothetical protein [Candidatus Saccharimonadales bacterium]